MSTDVGFRELPQARETWQRPYRREVHGQKDALVEPHACARHARGWRDQMCSGGDCRRYRVPIPSLTSILHLKSQREEAGLGGRCEATKQKQPCSLLPCSSNPSMTL